MNKNEAEVKERFEGDIACHGMEIVIDTPSYRHIIFKRPETRSYSFELITWPGYLCYTGDMGTFVFSRVRDMFEFFRSGGSRINPGYWAEKLQATNIHGGHEGYSQELLVEAIKEDLENFIVSNELDQEVEQRLREEVDGELIYHLENDMVRDVDDVAAFKFDNDRVFDEFYEHSFTEHTFHYLWCCYAIVWGIAQYDKFKSSEGGK